ncbi:MAG: hypothetical protein KC496_22720, partial [Anaerolineae bacterium]|nr:hypothetical protein [Anaerolineae bacterium]
MKRTVIGLGLVGIVVLAVAVGVFLYITRPVDEASENIQDNTETLSLDETDTSETVIYRIDQTASQVEFHINEVLNGSDFTAIGVTDEVAGDI